MCEALRTLRQELADWAARFEPARTGAADCEAVVAEAAAIENIAATVKAIAAASVAISGRWRSGGDRSAAAWLATRCGTTASQAKDAIETGTRLEHLDATAEAAKRGELSAARAAAVADAGDGRSRRRGPVAPHGGPSVAG